MCNQFKYIFFQILVGYSAKRLIFDQICLISFSSWKGDPSFHTVSLPYYDFRQLNRLIYIGT